MPKKQHNQTKFTQKKQQHIVPEISYSNCHINSNMIGTQIPSTDIPNIDLKKVKEPTIVNLEISYQPKINFEVLNQPKVQKQMSSPVTNFSSQDLLKKEETPPSHISKNLKNWIPTIPEKPPYPLRSSTYLLSNSLNTKSVC